ncbi:hypothetical protein [Sharpea azabuensis]
MVESLVHRVIQVYLVEKANQVMAPLDEDMAKCLMSQQLILVSIMI